MGGRRNKQRNAASLISLSFFRHEYRIVKIAHIGSRTKSEDQFLNAKVQFILVPPHFQLVPPHYVCSGDGTASRVESYSGQTDSKCLVHTDEWNSQKLSVVYMSTTLRNSSHCGVKKLIMYQMIYPSEPNSERFNCLSDSDSQTESFFICGRASSS